MNLINLKVLRKLKANELRDLYRVLTSVKNNLYKVISELGFLRDFILTNQELELLESQDFWRLSLRLDSQLKDIEKIAKQRKINLHLN